MSEEIVVQPNLFEVIVSWDEDGVYIKDPTAPPSDEGVITIGWPYLRRLIRALESAAEHRPAEP